MSNHRTLLQDMKRGINCRLEAIAAIESLEAEVEEQARLLGASGSREAELLARAEALEKEQSAWRKFTDEANRTLEAADKKIATLQARIEALEGGIREFIAKGHADNCLTFYILEKSAGKCDCGLDALAALLQEPTK